MKNIYFTIAGTSHYYGLDFFEPQMAVHLVKEPENKFDKEAIRVELEGLGKVGYVANSTYSVIGQSYSAGRLYDKIGEAAEGTVLYKLRNGILCILTKTDDPDYASESAVNGSVSSYSDDDEFDEDEYVDDNDKTGNITLDAPDEEIVF